MAKLDKVKEYIGFLKAIFVISVVIMSSLISYLYNKNIENNYLVLIALMIDVVVIIMLFKKIMKEINLLEEL